MPPCDCFMCTESACPCFIALLPIWPDLAGLLNIAGVKAMPVSELRTWIRDGSASDEYNGPKYFCTVTIKIGL